MYPITTTVEVTRALMDVAFANLQSKTSIREKEIAAQLEHYQDQERSYREEMRHETHRREIEAKREVNLAVLQLAQHTFDRKMDFFTEAFREVIESLKRQEGVLNQEKKELSMKEVAYLTAIERIQMNKQKENIAIDLANIRLERMQLVLDFNAKVAALAPELRLGIPRL